MADLCHLCRSILLDEAKVESQVVTSYEELGMKPQKLGAITVEYKRKDTYPNFPVLRESATVCRFCRLLLVTINAEYGGFLEHLADMPDNTGCENQVIITDVRYQTFNYNDEFETQEMFTSLKGLLVRMIFPDSKIRIPKLEIWFELSAHEDNPAAERLKIPRRLLEFDTLSEHNRAKIENWVRECDNMHKICHTAVRGISPTRLVDISGNPYLVITSTDMSFAYFSKRQKRYIAFSYCWGSQLPDSPPMLKLTDAQLELWTNPDQGIQLTEFPKSYQDLISICKCMGVRYAWIDSLCIVQDDEHDWERESAKMHDIYENAYLTVVPASISSMHQGFLSRPSPPILFELPFTSCKESGVCGSYYLRPKTNERFTLSDRIEELDNSPWEKRGWTFQEQFVSRRILYFGYRSISFHCCESRVSEAFATHKRPFHDSWISSMLNWNKNQGKTFYPSWHNIIAQVSTRTFTFENDLLPAISGVARRSQELNGDEYMAGLWRGDLPEGLLWRTGHSKERPGQYRGPSWTWVSVVGYVAIVEDRRYELDKHDCTIVDFNLEANGDDYYGIVSGGSLKILARAKHVHGVIEDAELARKCFGRGLGLVYCGRIVAWAAPDFKWKLEDLRTKAVSGRLVALLISNYRSRLDDDIEDFGSDLGSKLDENMPASDRSDEGTGLDESIESDTAVGSDIEIKENEEVSFQANSTIKQEEPTRMVRRAGLLLLLQCPASGSEEAVYQRIGIFWIYPEDNHGDDNAMSWFDGANHSEYTII